MALLLQKDPTQWFPMPAVLVTCRAPSGAPNVMGLGYIGFCSWDPPVLSIGLNTARYSRRVILETREFVVALPGSGQVAAMDYCGFVSGVDTDKFERAGLTPADGVEVAAPLVAECPVNLECRLLQVVPLGSHEAFLARVVAVHVDEACVAGEAELAPVLLLQRRYQALGGKLADFGVSGGAPPEPSLRPEHQPALARCAP